jgi:hypothetical protein
MVRVGNRWIHNGPFGENEDYTWYRAMRSDTWIKPVIMSLCGERWRIKRNNSTEDNRRLAAKNSTKMRVVAASAGPDLFDHKAQN